MVRQPLLIVFCLCAVCLPHGVAVGINRCFGSSLELTASAALMLAYAMFRPMQLRGPSLKPSHDLSRSATRDQEQHT
jgi:hypothetical protein